MFVPMRRLLQDGCKGKRSVFLTMICLVFGFDIRDPKAVRRTRLILIAFVVNNVLSIYPTAHFLVKTMKRGMSLAKFAFLCQVFVTYMTSVLITKVVGVNLPTLVRLLEGGPGLNWLQHLLIMLFWSPTSYYLIRGVFVSYQDDLLIDLLYYSSYIYRMLTVGLPLMMYLEAVSILVKRSRSLIILLHNRDVRFGELVRQKLFIRRRIADLNKLFSSFLAMIYIQLFTEAILAISLFVKANSSFALRTSSVFRLLSLIIAYITAVRSSSLMNLLINLEHLVLRQLTDKHSSSRLVYVIFAKHSCPSLQLEILRFSDAQDSPRAGCFVNSEQTFISYVFTGITIVAAIMQFDYKAFWVVDTLVKNHRKTMLT